MLRCTSSLCVSAMLSLIGAASGCASSVDLDADHAVEGEDKRVGSIGLDLNWYGRQFDQVSWTLAGLGATTQQYTGNLDISESEYFVSAVLDGIAAGSYRLEMESTADAGTQSCRGHVPRVDVASGEATDVSLLLLCSTPAPDEGSVNISGQFDDCTGILRGITVSPASVRVGEPITVTLDVDPGFSDLDWKATSGTFAFSNDTPTEAIYTCAEPGVQTLTATALTNLEDCDPSTREVMVTCQ